MLALLGAFALLAGVFVGPAAWAAVPPAGGCPAINAIGNFLPSNIVSASFSNAGDTSTYSFSSVDQSPTAGVPGLISYCVYPSQPPGNPDSAVAEAYGANGDPFVVHFGAIQGFFSFTRGDGNPSNIPLDGTLVQMGTATWTTLPALAPASQDIVLHINDAAECQTLYGGTSDTCFVLPNGTPPLLNRCPGDTVACKSVVIDEAIPDSPLTVPAFTQLHIHYTYLINNTTGENMLFYIPGKKTQDINSGGGKDYFGCEQQPDPSTPTPGAFGTYPNYEVTSFQLDFKAGSGKCDQSRFFLTNQTNSPYYVLAPGDSITFTIDMVTRLNVGKSRKYEYTTCGQHLLNSGFTVKWFQPSDYPLLHSFSTNITPLYVTVVGCKN